MVDLLSMTDAEASEFLCGIGVERYRVGQIFGWLMKGKDFDSMKNIPASLREKLSAECEMRLPKVERKQISASDGTVKYLFKLLDGACIESVLMKYDYGNTLCISSQVGCRMGCRFCASTLGGKERDLLPSEMLGQIIAAQSDSGERVSHVVMMGIGEPLDNYDNVLKFLRLVNSESRLHLSYRNISLSTCGIVEGIRMLAKEDIPLTLSVSLHAATDTARSEIMPINRRYPISELLGACRDYFATTGRRISFEYTLLSGVNDSPEHARELASALRSSLGNMPIHVNLIRLNEVKEREFKRTDTASAYTFADLLNHSGIVATVRRRLGTDIDAACGQLRRKVAKSENEQQND